MRLQSRCDRRESLPSRSSFLLLPFPLLRTAGELILSTCTHFFPHICSSQLPLLRSSNMISSSNTASRLQAGGVVRRRRHRQPLHNRIPTTIKRSSGKQMQRLLRRSLHTSNSKEAVTRNKLTARLSSSSSRCLILEYIYRCIYSSYLSDKYSSKHQIICSQIIHATCTRCLIMECMYRMYIQIIFMR